MSGQQQQRAASESRGAGAGLGMNMNSPYGQHMAGRPRSMNESRLTPGPGDEPSLSPQDYNLQQSNLALLRAELKLVTQERDSLRKELTKTLTERDVALRRLGAASASFDASTNEDMPGRYGQLFLHPGADSTAAAYATLSRHSSPSMEKWTPPGSKEHEKLKLHYERAILDLQTLKRQLNESQRACEVAKREADSARGKHKVSLGKLEVLAAEAGSLRSQFSVASAERDRLQLELKRLQALLDTTDRRKDAGGKEAGPVDAAQQSYRNAVYKYETMREEYEALRSRLDDVVASHSAAVSKLELCQEEVGRLKSQLEEVLQEKGAALRERTAAIRERDGLKQQCTSAIRQWDNALRERNEFKDALIKIQQKHEDANKEVNEAMALRIKAGKEVRRLTEERNTATVEINRILAERDTVHKEMERLQEDCTAAETRAKELESRNKDLTSELESLRREISSMAPPESRLPERDRAFRRAYELRDQLGAGHDAPNKSSWNSNINSYDNIQQERTKSKDSLDSGRLSDSKSYKERLDDIDTANVEVEKLRKLVEKLQQELHETQQEAEVSKRRRDWAFAERDKIVMERESIRQLCDRLRRERDRAVSDQAKALRDADDVRKQKNEANKELKDLREHMEHCHLAPYSMAEEAPLLDPSDRAEWESLQLSLDTGCSSDGLRGVALSGGVDSDRDSDGARVAAGRLMPGDHLLRVDSLDCANMSGRLVLDAIRNSVGPVRLLVRRRRPVRTTQLLLSDREYHGIGLEQGVYIARIQPGSAAARDGMLAVGDRLLMVNGRVVDRVAGAEAVAQLLDSSASLTITTKKSGEGVRSPLEFVRDMRRIDAETQHVLDQFNAVLESSEKADKRRRRGRRREERNGTWPNAERKMLVDEPSKLDKAYEKSEESLSSPFEPYYLLEEKYGGRSAAPPGLGASLTPSDTSIDFSVKSVKLAVFCGLTGACLVAGGRLSVQSGVLRTDMPGTRRASSTTSRRAASTRSRTRSRTISPVETGSSLAVTYHMTPEGAAAAGAAAGAGAAPVAGRAHLRSLYGSPLSFTPPFMPYTHTHTHTHAPTARYSSPVPVHLPSASSADERRSAAYDPTYEPSAGGGHNLYLHGPSPSLDYGAGYQKPAYLQLPEHRHNVGSRQEGPPQQRIRIPSAPHSRLSSPAGRAPSNTSVTSRASSGSAETTPDRDHCTSPSFSVEVINPGGGACSTGGSWNWRQKPLPGELRNIVIERSDKPLGISISCLQSGGVFVSEVIQSSLASQVNLQIGDQILEVCGINLRTANRQMAASVLSQCGDSRRILVQYNPDRYELSRRYDTHSRLSSGPEDEDDEDEDEDEDEGGGRAAPSRSGSPTPCNSPKPRRDDRERDDLPQSGSSTLRSPLSLAPKQNTLTRQQMSQVATSLKRSETVKRSDTVKRRQGSSSEPPPPAAVHRETQHHDSSDEEEEEESGARLVYLETASSGNLGIQLVGGNAVGIFVHSVEPASAACAGGLQCGDRILEYNGVDLRHASAEQAACELAKPADKVSMLVVNRHQRYMQVYDQPGDQFYIRALFDYQPESGNGTELKFHKDNILLVDNTMFNGQPGLWRAWLIDTSDGRKLNCGIIPSKFTVEDLMLKRSQGDISGDPGRRSAVSFRRSFFRRMSKHQRSSSRESRELASFSDVSINEFPQEPSVAADTAISSYQRVERLDSYVSVRPVLVLGPLSELISERLCAEYPHQFVRPALEVVRAQQAAIDQRVQQAAIVDYRRRGSHFQVLTAAAIREWCDGDRHCVLDMDVTLIPRLQRHRIHPIVLFVRFKSVKQIREVRESVYPMEKACNKAAKDMHVHACKLEHDYKHTLSATVQGGGNMAYLCTQVKAAVEQEQNKALWVPSGTI
ncbi:disks large homolog 5-like [Pollicipes pollicipes]|uniref:disks large homolog 5-like n=1 Tax=Pollicipes pollicipes TaxID=41117 RepID=UPI001884DFB9|nr:disks large homolog 5-like [Pollicipes pollicipes]